MGDVAIAVDQVSKCYRIYEDQKSRLLNALWPGYRRGMQELWALREVSFEVKKGESFAIIGRNGSGKSTLLEIITGTLKPTAGHVSVNGRVAALLELGSGFNPEYSGRENVFLNGLLLGLTRAEVEHRFDEIAGFADIGEVLDRPVKTYSSGMLVRLAFAVQVALEPDILIVDEALSVGDYFFQQKCFGRLRQMREDGLTLLLVSHDMGTVRDVCSQAVHLDKGQPLFVGDSKEAIRYYLAAGTIKQLDADSAAAVFSATELHEPLSELEAVKQVALWHRRDDVEGSRLLAVVVRDEKGQPISVIRMGDKVIVSIYLRAQPAEKGNVSLVIKNKYDQVVSNISTARVGINKVSMDNAPHAVVNFSFDCLFEAGVYSFLVAYGQATLPNRGKNIDVTDWIGPFRVDWNYESDQAPFLGMFGLPYSANITNKFD